MIIQGEDHIYYEFDKTAQPIGIGGMGVVYKGVMVHELTGTVRDVAIKEIQTDAEGPQRQAIIDQAEREASIRLMNDNLIEMIDFVQIEETRFNSIKKRYYVVSELLHGASLDKLLAGEYEDFEGRTVLYAQELGKRYALDREDTAALIVRNVLSGVMALHDKGYLHRDIDPSNVMVTDEGKIKILDFGIAKKHNRLSPEDGLQQEGAFVGKVEYAAPELINGNVQAQDFSTDIYSIGVLFYRLITGRLPFEGNRFDIMKGHQHRKPDLRSIKNAKYKAIIAKALQKNPQKRYHSSSEMRVALDGPDPMPSWVGGVIAGAIALAIVVAVLLTWNKDKPNNHVKNEDEIEDVITINTKEKEKKKEQDTKEYSIEQLNAVLTTESPQQLLKDNSYEPSILYASAQKAIKSGLDGAMKAFWSDTLLPEGEVDKWLLSRKELNSSRFAYVCAARALTRLDQAHYSPEAKAKLKPMIESLLATVRSRNPSNYKIP